MLQARQLLRFPWSFPVADPTSSKTHPRPIPGSPDRVLRGVGGRHPEEVCETGRVRDSKGAATTTIGRPPAQAVSAVSCVRNSISRHSAIQSRHLTLVRCTARFSAETWAHRFGVIRLPPPTAQEQQQMRQQQQSRLQASANAAGRPHGAPTQAAGDAKKLTDPMTAASKSPRGFRGPSATGIPPVRLCYYGVERCGATARGRVSRMPTAVFGSARVIVSLCLRTGPCDTLHRSCRVPRKQARLRLQIGFKRCGDTYVFWQTQPVPFPPASCDFSGSSLSSGNGVVCRHGRSGILRRQLLQGLCNRRYSRIYGLFSNLQSSFVGLFCFQQGSFEVPAAASARRQLAWTQQSNFSVAGDVG